MTTDGWHRDRPAPVQPVLGGDGTIAVPPPARAAPPAPAGVPVSGVPATAPATGPAATVPPPVTYAPPVVRGAPVLAAPPGATAAPATSAAVAAYAAGQRGLATAAGTAVASGHHDPGTGTGPGTPGPAARHSRPRRRRAAPPLTRLRIGSHTASYPVLAGLAVTPSPRGMIVGLDRDQRPVPIRFFRAQPTRVALIGGEWAGQVLSFRALGVGARVAVFAGPGTGWPGFAEHAVGRRDRFAVLAAHQVVDIDSGPDRPSLVVHDVGPGQPIQAIAPAPWQTQLVIVRELTTGAANTLADADLVVMQRLSPAEAAVAASVLRLTPNTAALLQVLEPDMVTLVGGGADRYVWLHPTGTERGYTGVPRR